MTDSAKLMSFSDLRRRAELEQARRGPRRSEQPEVDDVVRELEIQEIELLMQNDELRVAHAELREARDRYRELYDLAPVAHVTLDTAGRIVDANQTFSIVLGVEKAFLPRFPLASLLEATDADRLQCHLHDVFTLGGRHECELTMRRCDGVAEDQVRVHVTSMARTNRAGTPECRSVLVDLSGLRRAEQRLQQIVTHMDDVFFVEDADGLATFVSDAFVSVWGRASCEAIGRQHVLLAWAHSDDRERVAFARQSLLRGDPFDATFRIVQPGGGIRWVRARAFLSNEAEWGRPGIVGIAEDVTAERALEEELAQAQKMEVIGSLASGIAHDFNNVLQAVVGCIGIARDEDTSPERAQMYLRHATLAAKRGGQLAAQLLAFSRKQQCVPESLDLDVMLDSSRHLLERLVTERIDIAMHLGSRNQRIWANEVRIEQIVLNLVANARDAMPKGGLITIRTEALECWVRMRVTDTGTGMDAETCSRIFEPFFTTKVSGKGTGLGLATVATLVKQYGGRIEVTSALGKGTTFDVYFPRDESARTVTPRIPPSRMSFTGNALVIDDDALVRETIEHQLRDLGLNVRATTSIEQAEELCLRRAVDLVLCDVVLPGTQGPALAKRLKEHHPSLSVLFISANAELSDEIVAVSPHLLRKPFDRERLASKLSTMLPATDTPSSSCASVEETDHSH